MATYYKVVTVNRQGECHSAVITGKARLRYALGERTVGFEGMPVLVFQELRQASGFARRESYNDKDMRILAGKAGHPRRQHLVCEVYRGLLGFRAFWKGSAPRLWPAPDGTCAADWFEPQQVVQEETHGTL